MPSRLRRFGLVSVSTAAQWHFAMLNDVDRASAYRAAMERVIQPGVTTVLEIGAGSGILSMIAARLGARHIWAIEGNPDYARVARSIIEDNGLSRNITVIEAVSTSVQLGASSVGEATRRTASVQGVAASDATPSIPERPDVLVAELLGTTLDGESQLDYVLDARQRLCRPDTRVIPRAGAQFVSLIQSAGLASITAVDPAVSYLNLNLTRFNVLRDTVNTRLSRPLGVRLHDLGFERLAPRLRILDIDFSGSSKLAAYRTRSSRGYRVVVARAGRLHAAVFSWEAYMGEGRTVTLSTHPEETTGNLPRDVAWGHAVQILEDTSAATPYIDVSAGDELRVDVHFGEMSAVLPAVVVSRK